MAHMIPATVPQYTQSNAERQLFPVLRDALDEGYIVFHAFNLLTHNRQGKFIDGEIDYLIFLPDNGILVLEVKGGYIKYDGEQGIWLQNDRPLKISPFAQAQASKYKLRDFLTIKLGHAPMHTLAHAVCFPDVFTEVKNLPSGCDAHICITGQDLSRINDIVIRIVDSFDGTKVKPPDKKEAEQIRRILMPHCEYGVGLLDRIGQAEQIIFRLTENQCRLLDFISQHRQALIEGCAGSGKTVMAIKKARELSAEGSSVLLLAYNHMIGDYLSDSVNDLENVTACTYHKFCMDRLREAGRLPEPTENPGYWKEQIPEAFATLISEHQMKYDAVIVDEGQDFSFEYWVTVMDLVKEGGYFYIFFDPDQNLYGTEMELPINKEPFILTDNCRNTLTIFNKLKIYARTEMHLNNDAPQGEELVEFSSPDIGVRRRQLGKWLHDLVHNKGIVQKHIVVLGGHSIGRTCIGSNPRIGNFHITEEMEDGPNVIHYHTYMKFKGCEADAVILLDVDRNDERWADPMALYTTISRAKHLLYILYC